jgi:hypothetical protein
VFILSDIAALDQDCPEAEVSSRHSEADDKKRDRVQPEQFGDEQPREGDPSDGGNQDGDDPLAPQQRTAVERSSTQVFTCPLEGGLL